MRDVDGELKAVANRSELEVIESGCKMGLEKIVEDLRWAVSEMALQGLYRA